MGEANSRISAVVVSFIASRIGSQIDQRQK